MWHSILVHDTIIQGMEDGRKADLCFGRSRGRLCAAPWVSSTSLSIGSGPVNFVHLAEGGFQVICLPPYLDVQVIQNCQGAHRIGLENTVTVTSTC